jgi:hypothetical protein
MDEDLGAIDRDGSGLLVSTALLYNGCLLNTFEVKNHM